MLYPPWGPYVDPRCTMEYIPQTFVWGIVHHTLAKGLARAYIHADAITRAHDWNPHARADAGGGNDKRASAHAVPRGGGVL